MHRSKSAENASFDHEKLGLKDSWSTRTGLCKAALDFNRFRRKGKYWGQIISKCLQENVRILKLIGFFCDKLQRKEKTVLH